jgi:phosphate transport system permease protein
MTSPAKEVTPAPPVETLPPWARERRKISPREKLFTLACVVATWSSLAFLVVIVGAILHMAWGWLDWQLLSSYDSALNPREAGIVAGLWGTAWTILLTFLFAIPMGIGAGIYLEEYGSDSRLARIIRINLSNLAGVPSVVFGILGLTVFARMFGIFDQGGFVERMLGVQVLAISILGFEIPLPFGRCVLAGALTMALLILPVIIVATQEALRAVPKSLRESSLALGATKWQTVRHQILPAATPGILTGVILAISRAIGETAPLILIGAATFVRFSPGNIDGFASIRENPGGLLRAPFDKYTVLPIQIFNWVRQSKVEFHHVAAAAIIVLLMMLVTLNGVAIYIRNRFQKKTRW